MSPNTKTRRFRLDSRSSRRTERAEAKTRRQQRDLKRAPLVFITTDARGRVWNSR
jgi:hypothetical protein